MTSPHLRIRSASEIVDAAVGLARPHYAALCGLSLVTVLLMLPVYIGHVVAGPSRLPFGIPNAVGVIWGNVVGSVVAGAVVIALAQIYQGRSPDPPAALSGAWRRRWALTIVTFALWAITGMGLLLLIAPGLIVLARNGVAPVAAALEPTGARDAFRRSRYLSEGSRWKVLAVYGITYVPIMLLTWSMMAVVGAWKGMSGWMELAAGLTFAAISPFVHGALVVLYYDLRMVREAYDLEVLGAAVEAAS